MRKFLPFLTVAILSFCLFVSIPFVQAQSGYRSEYPISANFVLREGYFSSIPHPNMSNSFSEKQQRFLLSSFGRLNSMVSSERNNFSTCLNKYGRKELIASLSKYSDVSSRSLWDNWNLIQKIVRDSGNPPRRVIKVVGITRVPIYIDKINEQSNMLANANLGINWLQDGFRIRINEYNLNRSIANPQQFGDYTMWSGTILHEMMHNLGFNHQVLSKNPSNQEFESKVVGNLTYEAGWCVARSGQDKAPGSFSLTGNPSSPGFYVD